MSSDLLRRAATVLRERAEPATPGPWIWEAAPHGFPNMVIGNDMAVADTIARRGGERP
jgi:hypothetical protein